MSSSPLANKWVVITGASSGFGAAAARHFGAAGANVILGARRLDRLKQSAQQALKAGAPAAHVHELDVSQTASVENFILQVRQWTDHIDVLINNAGGALGIDPVATARDEDWETMMQTNVLGVLRMTRAALPLLLKSTGGYILNIGSVAGRQAYEGGAAYCAAKAGELQITRALRLELLGTGLRVGTVDPGLAETEFAMVRFKGDAARAKKTYEGMTPLNADDVAEALVWAASRPAHVCIDEMVIKATDQAAVHRVHRRTAA